MAIQHGMLVTLRSGRKTTSPFSSSIRELSLHREIEMFAGVAASSMPTVRLFFSHQNYSLSSYGSSLKTGFMRLLGRSVTRFLNNREGRKMKDLESNGRERKAAKVSPAGDTDSSFTQEELDDAAFRLLVTGHYHKVCLGPRYKACKDNLAVGGFYSSTWSRVMHICGSQLLSSF